MRSQQEHIFLSNSAFYIDRMRQSQEFPNVELYQDYSQRFFQTLNARLMREIKRVRPRT